MGAEPSETDARQAGARDPRAGKQPWYRSPYGWVTTTYYAEGFPYMVVNGMAEVLFTELGAGLRAIGLTALFHLPWNLKFAWAPFLDQYETKRRWLLGVEVALSVVLLALAVLAGTSTLLLGISIAFLVIAILSATHDAAIDGFYMEGLDEAGQAKFVGYRAAAYRGATVVVSGPLLVLAGEVGWFVALLATTAIMIALTVYHWFALPVVETRTAPIRGLARAAVRPGVLGVAAVLALVVAGFAWLYQLGVFAPVGVALDSVPLLGRLPGAGWIGLVLLVLLVVLLTNLARVKRWLSRHDSAYAHAFVTFLDQPKMARALAFILLFRTGESFLMKMRYPFLNREALMSVETYGWVNGTLGLATTAFATILGGHLIQRHGLRRWIWPFLIAQNVLNLSYWWLASVEHPCLLPTGALATVMTLEHFGAGLGTAVLMVYILRCADPRHKAAHMAIVTSLMSLGFTLAGALSGDLAESMGYQNYFLLTFFATIPSMVLAFLVPHLDGRERSSGEPDDEASPQ